jgi:hypothetical protein
MKLKLKIKKEETIVLKLSTLGWCLNIRQIHLYIRPSLLFLYKLMAGRNKGM